MDSSYTISSANPYYLQNDCRKVWWQVDVLLMVVLFLLFDTLRHYMFLLIKH